MQRRDLFARVALATLALGIGVGSPRPLAVAIAQEQKTEYVHGDPSGEIQYLVELINRARLDPAGEGERLFADYGAAAIATTTSAFEANDPLHWKRAENRDLWKSYAPRPALAFNRDLAAASRQWSVIMRTQDAVAQSFPTAPGLLSRARQQGYQPFWIAQLLQGFAPDVLFAHASWTIDWSLTRDPATGRTTLLNREAIINPSDLPFLQMVEIGVGIVVRNNPPPGGLGPKIVTVSLGASTAANTRFVTGVCYEDRDRNGRYDTGEGLAGVRVDVDRSDFFAITSTSGGYAIPLSGSTGPVTITARGVPGKASAIFGNRTTTGDTLAFGRPENVKADFVLPPRSAPPPEVGFDGATGVAVAQTATTFDVAVPAIDPARPTIGDLDLDLTVRHADRSRLRVALEAPDGTLVTLWEGGAGGADLVGSFDRTLRAREPLARFVDRPYEGVWRLHVEDAAGVPATVEAWRLRLRPRFEGPLHARAPHLFVSKLKLKDSRKPLGDRLTLKADIDVGVRLVEADAERLSLIVRETEAPYTERMRVAFAGPVGATSVALTGSTNVTFVPTRRGTSRARITLDLRDVDLPELPRDVRLELALGDLLVSEDVRLSKGRFSGRRTAPRGGALRIERVKSRSHLGGRRTDVRGRFLQSNLPGIPSIVEVRVGDAAGLWRDGPIDVQGTRVTYGPAGAIKKFTLDVRTGKFSIRAVGDHTGIDAEGNLDVSLWVGKYYEAMRVLPAVASDASFTY